MRYAFHLNRYAYTIASDKIIYPSISQSHPVHCKHLSNQKATNPIESTSSKGSAEVTHATPICRWAAGEPRSAAAAPAIIQPNQNQPLEIEPRRSRINQSRAHQSTPTSPIQPGARSLTLHSAWYSFWSRFRQPFSAMAKPYTATAARRNPRVTPPPPPARTHARTRQHNWGSNPIKSNRIKSGPVPRC